MRYSATTGSGQPPRRFQRLLPVGEERPIAVSGTLVRTTAEGLLAYQLHTLDRYRDEQLRQFIYQQHLQQEKRRQARRG